MLSELVTEVRAFLNDEGSDRWNDTRLLFYFNEGQKDLARRTRLIKDSTELLVQSQDLGGNGIYNLPKNVQIITGVELDGIDLPIYNLHNVPKCASTCSCGTPNRVIVDKTPKGTIQILPIKCTTDIETTYADTFGSTVTSGTLYGGVPLVTVPIEDGCSTIDYEYPNGIYGRLVSVEVAPTAIKVYYNRLPTKLTSLEDELEIDEAYQIALVHYVAGNLLRVDKDSNSRSLGAEELQLYNVLVRELAIEVSDSFTSGTHNLIEYTKI